VEEVGAELGTGLFRLMLHEVSQHPGNGWQLAAPYRSRRVLQLRFSCQVAGGGGALNGELVGDRAMSHVPSHWKSLVHLLQHFNYTADLPRGGRSSSLTSFRRFSSILNF